MIFGINIIHKDNITVCLTLKFQMIDNHLQNGVMIMVITVLKKIMCVKVMSDLTMQVQYP